ncbi:MAG TPA: adenosine kinase [Acidimicrobiales bacterium]|nr:adenosine kinase [Acidimicrobiales bacterium]
MSGADGETSFDVVAVGHAIVDVLASADEATLDRLGLVKGTMALVDAGEGESLYRAMGPAVEVSGGSAANTAVGVASMGGTAAFVGKVRDDQLGAVFAHDIAAARVAYATPPATAGPATGRCLVLVTGDAERTMGTYLGAAAGLAPSDVDAALVARGAVTYLEGYMWDPPEGIAALRAAMGAAHEAGRAVALSLSDPFCVARHREEFLELVDGGGVDVLFANEAEIVALLEVGSFDEAVAAWAGRRPLAALTRSAAGSVVVRGEEVVVVPAEPVAEVVDTTGAGDLYAAGFLFGYARGRDLATCARLGGVAAAEVISHLGARPQVPLADLAAPLLAAAPSSRTV